MTLSITNRGSGNHNSSATSFGLSPGSNCTAGATLVLCVSADNSVSNGATNNFTTVTDSIGNTWTKRQFPVFDNGTTSAGVQGSQWTTLQNISPCQTGTTITVSFGDATMAKTWTLTEVAPSSGNTAAFRTGGNKSAGATGTVLALGASASVSVGEVIVACFYLESGTTQTASTPDADATNGTWTTNQYNEIGTTVAGSGIISQAKLQTTTASTQSYDVTVGVSSDYHGSYVILQENTNAAVSFTQGADATTSDVDVTAGATVSFTQGADTTTSDVDVRVAAAVTHTQGGDAVASSAQALAVAAVTVTQAADAVASSATVADPSTSATVSFTQGGDTVTSEADAIASAVVAATLGGDTVVATSTVTVAATLAITQGADAVSAAGTVRASAVVSVTQGTDTVSSSAAVRASAVVAFTQAADTVAGSIGSVASAAVAITQGGDTVTASASGVAVSAATADVTQGADIVTTSVTSSMSAVVSLTQSADVVTASLVVPPIPVTTSVTSVAILRHLAALESTGARWGEPVPLAAPSIPSRRRR